MRWQTKLWGSISSPGDRRIVRRFLWFPRSFQGETRWLEFANIGQWRGSSGTWYSDRWALEGEELQ